MTHTFTFTYWGRTPLQPPPKRLGKRTEVTVIEYSRRYGPRPWYGPRTPGDRSYSNGLKKPIKGVEHSRQVTRVLNPKTMVRYPADIIIVKKLG